jgi:hypothetical protein
MRHLLSRAIMNRTAFNFQSETYWNLVLNFIDFPLRLILLIRVWDSWQIPVEYRVYV